MPLELDPSLTLERLPLLSSGAGSGSQDTVWCSALYGAVPLQGFTRRKVLDLQAVPGTKQVSTPP